MLYPDMRAISFIVVIQTPFTRNRLRKRLQDTSK